MRKLVGMTAALALFAGCAETGGQEEDSGAAVDGQEAGTPATEDILSAEGWGPLRIGMSRDEVVAAVGGPADPDAMGSPEPEFCDQFPPAQAPTGMFVMIENGILTSISLSAGSTLQTPEGLSVGDSADAVRAAYGDRLDALTHNYIGPPAEYLTVWSTGEITENGTSDENARGIRYETNADGVIELIHAGGPSIQYVEGCL
ncbi:MAG: hypothetical protein ACSHW2_07695 [Parasphingopyxis sp.]